MKILIFGAAGSGTTTLGKKVAKKMEFIHLDTDQYYWKPTEPPFEIKIPLKERNTNLKSDFDKHNNVIITGSMVSWGKEWQTLFDLVIFIRLNNTTRMERLKNREISRYGKRLSTDITIQKKSRDFLEWASQYENPNFKGRSLKIHNDWIKLLTCKVLQLNGAKKLDKKTTSIVAEIYNYQNK